MASALELSDRELRLLRTRSQRLFPGQGAKSVAAAAKAALTIQAQDVPAATLGVRVRTAGLTEAKARRQAESASSCRSWLMRNTIFLFASSDLAWMRPLLAERPLAQADKRFGELGMKADIERTMDSLSKRLARGPVPRDELREMLAERGHTEPQCFYWAGQAAALRGVLVVSPALDQKAGFAAAPPSDDLPDRDQALGRLVRRYLDAYGPATVEDFAYFFKMPKADARAGWERAGRTVEVHTSAGPMTALARTLSDPVGDDPVIRLLPAYDHYLLGWNRGRELTVPPAHQSAVYPGAGYIKATAFLDGLAFATWKLTGKRESLLVEVEPFDRLPRGAEQGLEREVADIGRYFEADAELRIG